MLQSISNRFTEKSCNNRTQRTPDTGDSRWNCLMDLLNYLTIFFMGCTKLEKVILPASLKFMNDGCFKWL